MADFCAAVDINALCQSLLCKVGIGEARPGAKACDNAIGRQTWSFRCCGPGGGADRQYPIIDLHQVEGVAHFIAAFGCEQLVGRKIDRMECISETLIFLGRIEAVIAVDSPVEPGLRSSIRDYGAVKCVASCLPID